MADFEPITSQEQLDAVIKDRLNRQTEKHAREIAEKYGDYDTLKSQTADYEKQIAELTNSLKSATEKAAQTEKDIAEKDAKIKSYELGSVKTRIASEYGLSYDAVKFLQGDTEDAIKQSAEALSAIVGKPQPVAPLQDSSASTAENGVAAAFHRMNPNLRK